jgi:predicted AAA+ superfamily ATPase
MDRISPHIGKPYVKLITGIRRSGKSTIMGMIGDVICKKVEHPNIIHIDFEIYTNKDLASADALYRFVKDSFLDGSFNVLMVDEIQEVAGWENVIRSLLKEEQFDIYVTGSNSSMLSSEYATRLGGRYVAINVQTLTFAECREFRDEYGWNPKADSEQDMERFLHQGGYPVVWTSGHPDNEIFPAIRDIYSSVVLKDICERHGLKNNIMLERIVKYLCDNIGNPTSLNNIYVELSKDHGKINKETVYRYVEYLEDAFVFHRVEEENIRGRAILSPKYKFYIEDLGIKNALMGYRTDDISKHLENIIYLEMRGRGYSITFGNVGGREVDFVCRNGASVVYIQVVYRISSDETMKREFGNLLRIGDGYPKYVVTMDPDWRSGDVDGIKYVHITDFLMMSEF